MSSVAFSDITLKFHNCADEKKNSQGLFTPSVSITTAMTLVIELSLKV